MSKKLIVEQYHCLSELESTFQIEYINNTDDFCRLIHQVRKDDGTMYRGVRSARYKMYSSAQRFYIEHQDDLSQIGYTCFLKKLYDVSEKLGNGYISKLYESVKHENYFQYYDANSNSKGDRKELEYNPIWAFYTLQHLTECSPLLDFSVNFDIALYFASKDLLSFCDTVSKNEIDNYIEIIAIKEKKDIGKMSSYMEDDGLEEKISNFIDKNYPCNSIQYSCNKIQYICYGGYSIPLLSSGPEYHFSFANENVIAQEGRLMITSENPGTPFEALWKNVFNEDKDSDKIQVYLIHKSLATEIRQYLCCKLLGKVIVPIKKDFKQEILRLIKNN